MTPTEGNTPSAPLRAEHAELMRSLQGLGERVEKLYELPTLEQMALARQVLEFIQRHITPHARAEEYTLYPAADWASGEGSHLTESVRYEHQIVARRCEALEKAVAAGAPAGRLMHLCYSILGLVAAHFQVTEQVVLPYLDKAFDSKRFEKEVLTPLRMERGAKR